MSDVQLYLLIALFMLTALFYTTVGHAGASGYLASMVLVGVSPLIMRPTALSLNILVSVLTVWRFRGGRLFAWKNFLPFALISVPAAYMGGQTHLDQKVYQGMLGLVLLLSTLYLIWKAEAKLWKEDRLDTTHIPIGPAIVIGGIVGYISGLTGTGGGIFLSPIILMLGWAGPKSTAGIAAPFIFVNSTAGLLGNLSTITSLPTELPYLAVAALGGAMCGTWLGIQKLSQSWLLRVLAMVMAVAGVKLLHTM